MTHPKLVYQLPPGAVQVHLGSIETHYKPRGSLQKNSLSEELLERLRSLQEAQRSGGEG